MKNIKRLLVLILAAGVVVLAGCSDSSDESSDAEGAVSNADISSAEGVESDDTSSQEAAQSEVTSDDSSVSMDAAYQDVLDEYIVLCAEYDEVYLDSMGDYVTSYVNTLSATMMYYHMYEGQNFFYARFDINSDGQEELVIGNGFSDEGLPTNVAIVDIYAFDGESAVKCVDDISLGDRSTLAIYENGAMVISGSGGASSESYQLTKLSDDGFTANVDAVYEYDGSSYSNGSELLDDEEFKALLDDYTNSSAEVTSYDWVILA